MEYEWGDLGTRDEYEPRYEHQQIHYVLFMAKDKL